MNWLKCGIVLVAGPIILWILGAKVGFEIGVWVQKAYGP